MAEALEQKENDLRPFLTKLDLDRLKEAKMKTDDRLQEMGRNTVRSNGKTGQGPVAYWSGAKKSYQPDINIKGQKGAGKGTYKDGKNYSNRRQDHENDAKRARARSRSPRRQQNKGGGKQQKPTFNSILNRDVVVIASIEKHC